jgi:putative transposase
VTGDFCTRWNERESTLEEKLVMPIKRYKAEQIVTMLRQIEVSIANGKTTPQACKEAEITMQTFYRWRKEYGGLKMDQAKRLKELEKENGKLKRLGARPREVRGERTAGVPGGEAMAGDTTLPAAAAHGRR